MALQLCYVSHGPLYTTAVFIWERNFARSRKIREKLFARFYTLVSRIAQHYYYKGEEAGRVMETRFLSIYKTRTRFTRYTLYYYFYRDEPNGPKKTAFTRNFWLPKFFMTATTTNVASGVQQYASTEWRRLTIVTKLLNTRLWARDRHVFDCTVILFIVHHGASHTRTRNGILRETHVRNTVLGWEEKTDFGTRFLLLVWEATELFFFFSRSLIVSFATINASLSPAGIYGLGSPVVMRRDIYIYILERYRFGRHSRLG